MHLRQQSARRRTFAGRRVISGVATAIFTARGWRLEGGEGSSQHLCAEKSFSSHPRAFLTTVVGTKSDWSDMARILFGVTTSPLKHFYILIANAERAVAINVNSESGYDLSRCDSGDWDAEANNSHECQFFARPS
jgi:hypothetical protein